MDFSEALKMLKNGRKICRSDWDIDEYLFLNDNGVIEYHSRFTTSTELDVVGAKDVMATDWMIYDLIGRVVRINTGVYGIITKCIENGCTVLMSTGQVGWTPYNTLSLTQSKYPEIKSILEHLERMPYERAKTILKQMENK